MPLVLASQTNAVQRAMAELPSFARLGVFDLQHERRSTERLVQAGFAFTESVRWWGHHRAAAEGNPALQPAYAALADLWAHARHARSLAVERAHRFALKRGRKK